MLSGDGEQMMMPHGWVGLEWTLRPLPVPASPSRTPIHIYTLGSPTALPIAKNKGLSSSWAFAGTPCGEDKDMNIDTA